MRELGRIVMMVAMIAANAVYGAGAIVDLGGETREIESGYFAELVAERGEAGEDWKAENIPAGYDWGYMAPNGYHVR